MATTPPELLVICLDVSPSMGAPRADGQPSHLETAVKAIDLMIQNKVLHTKKDEVGLVLFGTTDTKNNLNYEHITTARDIRLPDLHLLRFVENSIVSSSTSACFIDAAIVGMDLLVKTAETKKKCEKRLVMFTDAASDFNDSSDSQFEAVIAGLKTNEIKVDIIGIDFGEDGDDLGAHHHKRIQHSPRQIEAIQLLRRLTSGVDQGRIVSFSFALSHLSQFRKNTVKQVSTFRGCLEIADLKIPMWGYSRQRRATLPTFKKLSGMVGLDPANADAGAVERRVTYHLAEDEDKVLTKEEIMKGYKFGRDFIPYSPEDEESLKFRSEKRLAVICFAPANTIPRHHYMGGSLVSFSPPPGDKAAALAMSALAEALHQDDKVAVVRYVFRTNASPKLGILIPHIKTDYVSLFFVQIPFREDLRTFQFPSLRTRATMPTSEQQVAMDTFVDKMDLMEAWPSEDGVAIEALKPKMTFNPVIQHINQCVHHRAMNPDAPIPLLDEMIAKYINVPDTLASQAEPEIAQLKASFGLTRKTDTRGRGTAARLWQQGDPTAEDQAQKRARDMADDGDLNVTDMLRADVTQVGALTPVEDYVALVGRRTEDLLVSASEQLMKRIRDVIEVYIGGSVGQFLPMVEVLRKHLLRDEPKLFNKYFLEICASLRQQAQRQPFLDVLQGAGVTLVSTSESADSDCSPEEAATFWHAAPAPAAAVQVAPAAEDEDLLDLL